MLYTISNSFVILLYLFVDVADDEIDGSLLSDETFSKYRLFIYIIRVYIHIYIHL